jgi:LPXTG-site transpeptidase (sortase) family protein
MDSGKLQIVRLLTLLCVSLSLVLIVGVFNYSGERSRQDEAQNQQAAASSDLPLGISAQPTSSLSAGEPQRLVISKLGVDAKVQYVGITAKGTMGIPSNFKDVAWYKYGPKPGEYGSAVIAGHLDNGLGLAAVFKKLGDLVPGDEIEVSDSKGVMRTFRVEKTEVYDYDKFPSKEVFSEGNGLRLNLITCDGVWLKDKRSYDKRLVVFASYVSEEAAR